MSDERFPQKDEKVHLFFGYALKRYLGEQNSLNHYLRELSTKHKIQIQ